MMIKRLITQQIQSNKRSVLLLGPRQTGKSTLLSSLNPDLSINLARENEFLRYSANPDLFIDQVESSSAKVIFVDEVQRIPGLLNSIQALIDENRSKRPLRFFLSGSSARKLKRGQANLLPGRVFPYQLSGLCAQELQYKVETKRALQFGFLPEPYFEQDDSVCAKLLTSYSALYLKEEIQAEALARNIQGFARFLLILAKSAGHILDFSKLSNLAKVSRTSSIRFVEILEDTWIAERVSVFEDAEGADCIRHPKLYFFDVGVLNGLLENFSASLDRLGILFEHLVYTQIRNSALALDLPVKIQYFRTRHGVEVDFIVTIRDRVWAIEVKSGDISSADLSGLKAFKGYYPKVHRCVAVSPREKTRQKDGVLICDWLTLLKEMDL